MAAAAAPREFSVYLLTPRASNLFLQRTYVGFTVNLPRRLRQHNREIKGGAWKTGRCFPWDFVCHVSGFSTKAAALGFEWMWQHPERSKRAREVIKSKVKGKRGVGRVGSVKRKLIELSWLLGLKDDDATAPKLRVNLNNALFNTNEGPITIVEFMDKVGILQQEIIWPEHIIVCTILLPVSSESDDEEDSDEGEQIGHDTFSSSEEEENEQEVGVIDLTSPPQTRPQPKVIDLTTPIKLTNKSQDEEEDILKFDFRKL